MRDYLYAASGTSTTITLAGLAPAGEYDLVVFSNPDLNTVRTTRCTVNSVAQDASSNGRQSILIRGRNYVRYERTRASSAGEIVITMTPRSGSTPPEGDINGLELQALPTPAAGACCLGAACTTATPANCTGVFLGLGVACAPPVRNGVASACCPADFNNSGAASVQDIFDFLAAYFAGCP
jgi:hypothetical protein